MDPSSIINAAVKKMQNFVSIVTDQSYDNFIQRERMTKHKILLFTDKKTTPTIYKALSKKFLNRLIFGEIRSTEEDLINNFKIKINKFPVIAAL